MDCFWSTVQACARMASFLSRIDTRSSIGISAAAFLLVFFSETELSKTLDQRFADWAAFGSKAVFLVFAFMLCARHGPTWWQQLQALSSGVAIELPAAGWRDALIFRNTGTKGPLHGEVLHYELRLRLRALRNLRNARASVAIVARGGREPAAAMSFADFGGDLPRGHESTVLLATLEIEHRGMATGSGIVPHAETSPVRMQLCGHGAFVEVGASSMHDFTVTVRHASGDVTCRLLLWVWGDVPTPGSVHVLNGPAVLAQVHPA